MTVPDSAAAPARPSRPLPPFGEFVAMIAALMALAAMSIDIMLPALPNIAASFAVADPNAAQLVVTHYLLGFAAGQLFFGPLSDRFGRRAVLFAGLGLYALAAAACLVAGSFEVLLAARFAQGLACAAPRVIAVAVVRDVYGGRRMAQVMSFVMMVFIVVPVVAPSAGGAILLAGSWPAIFAFLLALALALIGWTALRLPETRAPEHRIALRPRSLGDAFLAVLRSRPTLGYAVAGGVVLGALMGYIASAQQVYVEVYRLGVWFPLVFGAVALAQSAASFTNSRLVMRLGMRRLSHAALAGFAAISVAHLALTLAFGTLPLAAFGVLLAATFFAFGFVMPNFNALAMEPMGRIAGTASSFVGAATTGLSATLGWAVGQQFDGGTLPLLAGFALYGMAALGLVALTERGRLFAEREEGGAGA
jgi:DHA1 family bicyclomycin/chloramphenicol resistance-like MFS transporter